MFLKNWWFRPDNGRVVIDTRRLVINLTIFFNQRLLKKKFNKFVWIKLFTFNPGFAIFKWVMLSGSRSFTGVVVIIFFVETNSV